MNQIINRSDVKENEVLLEVKGLKKHFPIEEGFLRRIVGHVKAVDGVDFYIREGETLGLVGESGCGKSTLLRIISGLEDLDEGEILINSEDVTSKIPSERKLSMVFTNFRHFSH